MPSKTSAPAKKAPAKTTETKARSQDSQKLGPSAEGLPLPTDESAARHQEELDQLSKPGRARAGDAEQIDGDPGYSKDQLLHMREYWGLQESTAEVADT